MTKCPTCDFGKGHHQLDKLKTIKKNPMKDQDINNNNIIPGQMMSADHYILRATGRIYNTKKNADPS